MFSSLSKENDQGVLLDRRSTFPPQQLVKDINQVGQRPMGKGMAPRYPKSRCKYDEQCRATAATGSSRIGTLLGCLREVLVLLR